MDFKSCRIHLNNESHKKGPKFLSLWFSDCDYISFLRLRRIILGRVNFYLDEVAALLTSRLNDSPGLRECDELETRVIHTLNNEMIVV